MIGILVNPAVVGLVRTTSRAKAGKRATPATDDLELSACSLC
jgi:hypothetical protein